MGLVKVVKNKAYYKRFQTKFRRRREAKTDYYARKRLIVQDKNKYETPKYRLVVRFANREIICQIFATELKHDVCLASAYSHELARYGVKAGLKNYAAAYATGLLLARRVNAKFKLEYDGVEEADGEEFIVEYSGEGPRPFKALLDVGLVRTTTGARVFGALKGAVDGGLNVPHNCRRFPGSAKEAEGEMVYEPEVHKKYITSGHVADYMRQLKEEDEAAYNKQFSKYIEAGVGADDVVDMWLNAHKAIRENPDVPRGELELGSFKKRSKPVDPTVGHENKKYNQQRTSVQQRKNRVRQKLLAAGKVKVCA